MFTDTINKCAANAARIVRGEGEPARLLDQLGDGRRLRRPRHHHLHSAALVDPSVRPLVMGATFGIALTLVIIAGSELFTGHTMFLTLGVKAGTIRQSQMWAVLPQTARQPARLGAGGADVLLRRRQPAAGRYQRVHSAALAKTTAPAEVLFFKGCCATGWFARRFGWRSALKAPPSSSPFGGACWPLSPRVTNTPSPT